MVLVGVDFDDTLSDRKALKKRLIERSYGSEIDNFYSEGRRAVSLIGEESFSEIMGFLERAREGVLQTLPLSHSMNILRNLSNQKYNFSILSASSKERKSWIEEWVSLQNASSYFLDVNVIGDNGMQKEDFCEQNSICVLIDNEPRHFTFKSSRLTRILLSSSPYTSDSGILVARNWKEIYNLLKNIREMPQPNTTERK